ncbi:MAG: hypothetical protein V4503_05950 [Gemmatimonadota bacterium]
MRHWKLGLLVILAATGCAKAPPRAAVTERQRDSVIGQSRLPGAGGVRGAMRAGDTAVAHNALRDSLAQEP